MMNESLFVKTIWKAWPAFASSAAVSYVLFVAEILRLAPAAPLGGADAEAPDDAEADGATEPDGAAEPDGAEDADGATEPLAAAEPLGAAEPLAAADALGEGGGSNVQPGEAVLTHAVSTRPTTSRTAASRARRDAVAGRIRGTSQDGSRGERLRSTMVCPVNSTVRPAVVPTRPERAGLVPPSTIVRVAPWAVRRETPVPIPDRSAQMGMRGPTGVMLTMADRLLVQARRAASLLAPFTGIALVLVIYGKRW
jgi:hypothetical protein